MNIFNFDNSYNRLDSSLYTVMPPVKVKSPEVVIYNNELADKLGLSSFNIEEYLSGKKIPFGAEPLAQAYAGHQFGYLNILGDGRAILLGEHLDKNKKRFDIQFKGSGITPYSRGGDGKATLSSMLREYIISYAMEKLHIPTTKSLAVVKTGEDVFREEVHQGAVLTRVASSHIRVGTFQYVALKGDVKLLKQFADYTIERHYPEIAKKMNPYLSLLESVMDRQIDLIINWMRVGFIHGVMNTDNMAISGETIDFGPCAFMDIYDPDTVFSSIDRNGRYSYKNQQYIGQWNLARFAETLIPLVDPNTEISLQLVNEIIDKYNSLFHERWMKMMGQKIGLNDIGASDYYLVYGLLHWMHKNKVDFTKTFRMLASTDAVSEISGHDSELEKWFEEWSRKDIDKDLIRKSNPSVIPRNHIVEYALSEFSNKGNRKPTENLLDALEEPYSDVKDSYYSEPPSKVDPNYRTFCGT